MSYDLHLFRTRANESADDAVNRLFKTDIDPAAKAPPIDPVTDARNREIAAAITAVEPTLIPFHFDYAAIAAERGITEEQARRTHRHIELNEEPEPVLGLQVTIHDETVTITVPYWHNGEAAARAFGTIRCVCEAISPRWNLRLYDPQLDRETTWEQDWKQILAGYQQIVSHMSDLQTSSGETDATSRPWWRLWK